MFGTISGQFDDEMWEHDARVFGDRFLLNVEDIHMGHKIKLSPADSQGHVLDTASAIEEIHRAIGVLNSVSVGQPIRIVHIGCADSGFFFQGVEYLLKRWHPGVEDKKIVHFLTTGDTNARIYENFCKSLVLRNFCTEIEFYNCQDYHPFGEYTYSHK